MRIDKAGKTNLNILVTGHNGYIGSVMMPVLQAAGHRVTGLDTFFFKECTFTPDAQIVHSLTKDVRDLKMEDLQGFDAIIHLAALSNDLMSDLNPAWTYDINHAASVHLAKIAKETGIKRFLYSSSCSVYGTARPENILTEDAPIQPLSHYALSKARAEEDIAKLADPNFSPVFMRSATAYGVSPQLRTDLVLNNLVGWAYTTGKIRILREVTPWRPLIHVEDIARAFVAVLTAPQEAIHNQTFNVGVNGENYQVHDLIEIVQEEIPGCELEYAIEGEPDPRSYRVDFSKLARTFPNLRFKWNVRLGVKQLYETFQRIGLELKNFQGRKYIRLAQLKHLLKAGCLDETLRWKNPELAPLSTLEKER